MSEYKKIDLPTLPIFRPKGQTNPYLFRPYQLILRDSFMDELIQQTWFALYTL